MPFFWGETAFTPEPRGTPTGELLKSMRIRLAGMNKWALNEGVPGNVQIRVVNVG